MASVVNITNQNLEQLKENSKMIDRSKQAFEQYRQLVEDQEESKSARVDRRRQSIQIINMQIQEEFKRDVLVSSQAILARPSSNSLNNGNTMKKNKTNLDVKKKTVLEQSKNKILQQIQQQIRFSSQENRN